MYSRGYLSFNASGPVFNDMPATHVADTTVYRAFDLNLRFHNITIWSKPVEVTGNVIIEGGTVWCANLLCPQGNVTIEGDLKDSRITVPNGTLTTDGVSGSWLTARRIVTHGLVENTVERGTAITNTGTFGTRARIIKISGQSPIVGPHL